MAVEWDPAKAASNFRKHGVRFADAVSALQDDRAISIRDDRQDEDRLGDDRCGQPRPPSGSRLHMERRPHPIDFSKTGNPEGKPPV